MPLVQREFVHDQAMDIVSDELAMHSFQSAVVDLFDGMPVQAGQLGDMGNRQELSQCFDPHTQSLRYPGAAVEPTDVLDYARSAVVTVHAADRYVQPDTAVKAVSFPDQPTPAFMDQHAILSATAAARWRIRILGQFQNQRAIGLLTERFNKMPFPEGQAQHSIRHGGGLDD